MRRFLMGAIVCLAFAASAAAQQSAASAPATRQDVEKYLQTIHMHRTMLRMVEAMSKPMHRMIHEEYLKDKDRCNLPPDFEAQMDKIMDEQMKTMPWDQLIQATVPIYQKHFTKADIAALTEFFSGPTGQKLWREMPAITSESMQAMMPIMLQQNAAMTARLKNAMAKIEKESGQTSCVKGSAQQP